jgi:hypothetical protein
VARVKIERMRHLTEERKPGESPADAALPVDAAKSEARSSARTR